MEPLRQAFDMAKTGDQFIFPRTITGATNLRKGLFSIIKKAGISPWPKLFQNLRASRETELCQKHPLHVVAAWIGNTPTVAIGHYLQVIDSDWERAASTTTKSDTLSTEMAHFRTYSGDTTIGQDVSNSIENGLNSSVLAIITEELLKKKASRQGLEP